MDDQMKTLARIYSVLPGDVTECLCVGVAEEGGKAGEKDVGDNPDLKLC